MGDGLARGLQSAQTPVPTADGTRHAQAAGDHRAALRRQEHARRRTTRSRSRARPRPRRSPIYTIALGTDSGEVVQQDAFGFVQRIPVPPDKATLRDIARITGGRFFEAVSADDAEDDLQPDRHAADVEAREARGHRGVRRRRARAAAARRRALAELVRPAAARARCSSAGACRERRHAPPRGSSPSAPRSSAIRIARWRSVRAPAQPRVLPARRPAAAAYRRPLTARVARRPRGSIAVARAPRDADGGWARDRAIGTRRTAPAASGTSAAPSSTSTCTAVSKAAVGRRRRRARRARAASAHPRVGTGYRQAYDAPATPRAPARRAA